MPWTFRPLQWVFRHGCEDHLTRAPKRMEQIDWLRWHFCLLKPRPLPASGASWRCLPLSFELMKLYSALLAVLCWLDGLFDFFYRLVISVHSTTDDVKAMNMSFNTSKIMVKKIISFDIVLLFVYFCYFPAVKGVYLIMLYLFHCFHLQQEIWILFIILFSCQRQRRICNFRKSLVMFCFTSTLYFFL